MLIIKVVKVPAALKGKVLVQPEVQDALETVGERLAKPGRGLGERRNTLNRQREQMGQRIQFGIDKFPRRTGRAKTKKMIGIFNGMSSRVIKKMAERILARWRAG